MEYLNHRSWGKKYLYSKILGGIGKGSEGQTQLQYFNLAMENVLKGLPDKISCPYIIHKCTSSASERKETCINVQPLLGHPVSENYGELVSNIEEQFRIVFMYTGNLFHLHDLAIWKWLKKCVHLKCICVWCNFSWEELKWLQICEFLIEIIFILFLNTTLFYNFMLPVNRYLAINIGVWLIKGRSPYNGRMSDCVLFVYTRSSR
jgi:hypothetical protein